MAKQDRVVFLNPRTCGIYKDGGKRYKTDPATGRRTDEIDNELIEHVEAYLAGKKPNGIATIPLRTVVENHVLVPIYYDSRYQERINELLEDEEIEGITIGELA